MVDPADDDLPTQKLAAPEVPEEEYSTVRLQASAFAEMEQLDLPTIRLGLVRLPIEPDPIESAVELTRDALPLALLQPALPFMHAVLADEPLLIEVKRVATIAAELVGATAAVVVARHGLTIDDWFELERTWTKRVAAAIEVGEKGLRDAYDEAYLAARTAHRGVFDEAALAELRSEIGRATDDSPELGFDVADAMRFRRRALRASVSGRRAR